MAKARKRHRTIPLTRLVRVDPNVYRDTLRAVEALLLALDKVVDHFHSKGHDKSVSPVLALLGLADQLLPGNDMSKHKAELADAFANALRLLTTPVPDDLQDREPANKLPC